MFQLKPLSKDAIPGALEKAVRYRLLNEPLEAESICRDVLDIEPENQQALATLVLALTDQFRERLTSAFPEAQQAAAGLTSEYEKAYYAGIICERRAKAHLRQPVPDAVRLACDWFSQALHHYERAEPLRPTGNDEAILRWNACARILMKYAETYPQEPAPGSTLDLE